MCMYGMELSEYKICRLNHYKTDFLIFLLSTSLLRRYVFHNENTRDLFLLPYPDFADVIQYYSYARLIKSSFIGSFYVTCQSIIDVNKAIDQNIHSRTRIDRVFFLLWSHNENVAKMLKKILSILNQLEICQ